MLMEANSSFLFLALVPPLCGVTPPRAIMDDADFPSSLFPRRAYYLVAITFIYSAVFIKNPAKCQALCQACGR